MNKATGYIDVYNTCRNQILNGEISSGERLPSIRELAKFRSVSIVTAQRAMAKLQQDGYVKSNGRYGCIAIDAWSEPGKSRSYRNEEISRGQRPLKVGILACWEKDKADYVFPPNLAIERILTSRVFGSGGSVVHFKIEKGDEQSPEVFAENLLNSGMDAFFIVNFSVSQEWNARLASCLERGGRVCVSYCEGVAWNGVCDSIIDDDMWGSKELVASLCRMGHRRIAFAGIDSRNPMYGWVARRISAWRTGLLEMGREAPLESVFLFGDDYDVRGKLNALKKHTAVVCCNDAMAIGVIKALRSSGLRVPEDVSVTGYDNHPLKAPQFDLTTTAISEEKVVSLFLSLVSKRMSRDESLGEHASLWVRPIIIPRGSWKALVEDVCPGSKSKLKLK